MASSAFRSLTRMVLRPARASHAGPPNLCNKLLCLGLTEFQTRPEAKAYGCKSGSKAAKKNSSSDSPLPCLRRKQPSSCHAEKVVYPPRKPVASNSRNRRSEGSVTDTTRPIRNEPEILTPNVVSAPAPRRTAAMIAAHEIRSLPQPQPAADVRLNSLSESTIGTAARFFDGQNTIGLLPFLSGTCCSGTFAFGGFPIIDPTLNYLGPARIE